MGISEAVAHAKLAAEAWGGFAQEPELIRNRENIVFRARLRSGPLVAVRLHRPGYQPVEAIRSELRWTECLADAGFACPWPERTTAGDFIYRADKDQPVVSVIRWLPGVPISEKVADFQGFADRESLHRQLGALLADLHLTADAVSPDDLVRHRWDAAAFCDLHAPLWGRYWENAALTWEQCDLLCKARDCAKVRLARIPEAQFGMIHGDVLPENVLRDGKQMYLIDFDDSGPGYRLYDLATALVSYVGTPAYAELRAALKIGYLTAHGPLPEEAFDDLEMFVMLRAMASAGWIMARAASDDPRQALYAQRAVFCAEEFLERC